MNEILKFCGSPVSMFNGYGMSEVGGCVSCMFENTKIDGTVGKPISNSSAIAVNINTGEELSYLSEENGEIEFWFDCRLEGYHGIKLLPEGEITVSLPFHFKTEEAKASAEADALSWGADRWTLLPRSEML